MSLITDANGNQMSYRTPNNSIQGADTLGRNQPFESSSSTSDYSGCVSRMAINSAILYSYPGPGGTTQQIKVCVALFPFHSAFNQALSDGTPVIEAQNYSANYNTFFNGYVVPQIVTVVLADGHKWTFDYDDYLEATSVGIPTGGSINLTWTTIGFNGCSFSSTAS